jgi:glutamine amidotransferase
MIAIVDYGIGNIKSLMSLLEGEEVILTDVAETLMQADVMILPGVGAFGYAMNALRERGLDTVVKAFAKTGKPLIGICLGMQLLYESSEEYGFHEGLGLLKGQIKSLPDDFVKPHMGWNKIDSIGSEKAYRVNFENYMYFVHSYYAVEIDESTLVATTQYGTSIPAIVQSGNLIGFQGHPEKSGTFGAELLKQAIATGEVSL